MKTCVSYHAARFEKARRILVHPTWLTCPQNTITYMSKMPARIHRSLNSLAAVVMRPLSMRRACALVILVCIARHSLSIVIGIQQRDLDEGLLVLGDL